MKLSILKKLWAYLTLRRDKEFANNKNLRMMHGINKISLFLFLFAIIYLIVRIVR